MEKIVKIESNGDRKSYFKALCSECGADRGYKRKIKLIGLCKSCSFKHNIDFPLNVDKNDFKEIPSPTKNNKDRVAFLYKAKCTTCLNDKGYVRPKDFIKPCLSCAAKQRHSNMQKDKKELVKIKISCTQRDIKIEDFNDFSTDKNEKERSRFKSSDIRKQCFENANHTCDLYGIKGCELNAHHLQSWDKNEEGRFELDNLVCLSEPAHKLFHKKYGKGNNTKEQYEELKKEVQSYIDRPKQDLYLVAGVPASGKSWVCNQLKDKFNYVSYDGLNKDFHIYELLKNNDKQLLFDPTIKISTFTKRISHLFNIKLVIIVESEDVLNQRIIDRGGKITNTIKRRMKRMADLSKRCEFSGTSDEVLKYLTSK